MPIAGSTQVNVLFIYFIEPLFNSCGDGGLGFKNAIKNTI
jgi:hypothetical protein